MEPRFNKAMRGGNKPPKKPMYLRLPYTNTKKNKPSDCPGGKQNCRDCKANPNIIPPEALVEEQSGVEAIAELFTNDASDKNPCDGSICDACRECDGEGKR